MIYHDRKKSFVIILLTWSLLPLLIQLYTSFCSNDVIVGSQGHIFNSFTLDNYIQVLFSKPPFTTYLFNSFIVGILTTITTLLLAIPASYGITKLNNSKSYITKIMLMFAALFPYVLLFLALLELARSFNLGNNLLALIIPYTGLSLPLAILLLTSAFNDLPDDLEEAAILEGLNIPQRIRLILVPLISPAAASTAILVFLFSWNEYPIALTWISRTDLITLPVAIARIASSSIYTIPYGSYAAATVLGSIPLLLIVMLFQKQIISGLTQGAIKG